MKVARYCNCLLAIIVILNSVLCSNSSPPSPEVAAAVKTAIDYFNNTLNLADRVEMVEQFYELEKEEGYFLIARHRIVPTEMAEISNSLEILEYEAKNAKSGDKTILKKINDLQEQLSHNYGPKEANFRIKRDDPIIENMRAAMRMKTHWEGLMGELNNFALSQQAFFHNYKSIVNGGIELSPKENPDIMLILEEATAQDFLNKYPKSLEFQDNLKFQDIYEKLNRDSSVIPTQTSQELQTLQSFLNGELIDPYSREMLKGFIPDLNKKALLIIGKMRELENTIETLDEQSQDFANHLLEKRNEMHELLDDLKSRFDSDYKDEL